MGKFQTLGIEPLEGFSVRISQKFGAKQNWKHEEINTLPTLHYEFDDSDAKFHGKEEDLRLYRNNYWSSEIKSGISRQAQYERDLRDAVRDAIQKVEDKWNTILAKDLKKDFK